VQGLGNILAGGVSYGCAGVASTRTIKEKEMRNYENQQPGI
jgi:hypothetical protein